MGDFSFSATAQCDYCGNLLSSSTEDCEECSDDNIYQQFFRRLAGEEKHIVVEATHGYKWYKLEEQVGEDWIAYEWLGPRESVQNMVGGATWESVEDLPKRSMSLDAPSDVGSD